MFNCSTDSRVLKCTSHHIYSACRVHPSRSYSLEIFQDQMLHAVLLELGQPVKLHPFNLVNALIVYYHVKSQSCCTEPSLCCMKSQTHRVKIYLHAASRLTYVPRQDLPMPRHGRVKTYLCRVTVASRPRQCRVTHILPRHDRVTPRQCCVKTSCII
ncbi:hypothetical protein DFH29DRAFT_955227 [Suillus ampliporus]|nr:hypothetical protein DFH29DRAFT_955227 [Suillus ampliporus]